MLYYNSSINIHLLRGTTLDISQDGCYWEASLSIPWPRHNLCRKGACGNVWFLHGCFDVFHRSWDKGRNPCLCRNHTFPNLVHHQNLESIRPVALCFPAPIDDAPCWEMCDFRTGMGSCCMISMPDTPVALISHRQSLIVSRSRSVLLSGSRYIITIKLSFVSLRDNLTHYISILAVEVNHCDTGSMLYWLQI